VKKPTTLKKEKQMKTQSKIEIMTQTFKKLVESLDLEKNEKIIDVLTSIMNCLLTKIK
jgi:uncharacterized protein YjgD (DUF1641 family)